MKSIRTSFNYYFNTFFPNYRGDSKIKEYFQYGYNNAIIKLTEEGYELYTEFERLCNCYKLTYNLNNEETLYINSIRYKYLENHMNIHDQLENNIEKYELFIHIAKCFIISCQERINFIDLQYENNIIKNECHILSIEIKKLKPIFEAVNLRIFNKKLLEILIRKNINSIDVVNYFPEVNKLKCYLKSLKCHYIKKKESKKDIQKEITDLIQILEKKEINSDNSFIKYNNDNPITQIIKLLFNINKYCNKIVHSEYIINFNMNEYIKNNFKSYITEIDINENNENEEEVQKTINNNYEQKKTAKFSVKDIAEFIAYGKSSHTTLLKLKELSKKITKK